MGGIFGGGGTHTYATKVAAMRVQTSAYGQPVPILCGCTRISANLIWYGDFKAIPHTTTTSGGKGGGGKASNTEYTYNASVAMGLAEGKISKIGYVWRDKDRISNGESDINMSLYSGTLGQSPWGYLSTYHPDQAIPYSGVAYVASSLYDLGNDASLPNHNFEAFGNLAFSKDIPDANPAAVLTYLLTDSTCGAGFPAEKIGDLSQMSRFCVANGVFISPFYDQQQPASDIVESLCKIAFCAPFFSEGRLKIVPYSDAEVTDNGVTFTPDLTVRYDLNDDDFIADSDDPVLCVRKAASDCENQLQVKYYDRSNDYNEAVVTACDQAAIDQYGLRTANTEDMHEIVSGETAALVANMQLSRRCYIRNTYKFKLGAKYMLLEPMDIVTLTDAWLGLNKTSVRITSIEEDGDFTFSVETEEFPLGVCTPTQYPVQGLDGYINDYNIPPGNTNTPFVFDAPGALTDSGYELWLGACGGENWGGCQIWVSDDDLTYQMAGSIRGAARLGYLSEHFLASDDPDETNALSVDLSISGGVLDGGSVTDADNGNTLALIENELIAYTAATLTGENNYTMSDYIRRGVHNSIISTHLAGARFLRVDQGIARYAYDADKLGRTIYLKFPAFNVYGGAVQSLADVDAYSYTIGGSTSYPNDVTGFSAAQNNNVVIFSWDLPADNHIVAGFDIRYAPMGDKTWSHGTPLTQVTRGTQITSARVAPGSWTFMVCARDIGGNASQMPAYFDLDIINDAAIVAEIDGTLGETSGFIRHWTGSLVPDGTKTCDQYDWEVFDQFVPDPVPVCMCESPVIDATIDSKIRIHGEIISALGPAEKGVANPLLQINYRTSDEDWLEEWQDWTIGSVFARYVKQRVYLETTIGNGVSYIKQWRPTIDAATLTQTGNDVAIGTGGTNIAFPQFFHNRPGVTAIALATTGLIANVDPACITNEGFTVHVYDTSGTDIGGLINWTATGV